MFAVIIGATLWAADRAATLGYDFLAYHQAANRVLAGEPLYDVTVEQTGGFGLFYYPPPFVLGILPFAPLDPVVATWVWIGLSIAAFFGGVALMPVSTTVRWAIVLLGALSWPLAYALKLGQAGPLLFLLFAIGWGWLDSAVAVGGTAALGTIVKIQPGLVLFWALLTRRWAAVGVGMVVLVAAAVIATLVAGGPGIWSDYVTLIRNVSDPITTPHNFTPGAIAYQLGAPSQLAAGIQVASSVAAVLLVIVVALRGSAPASYLLAVTASQLLSPVLWDHYAMLLLLPVAYLVERGQVWALLVPLATSILLITVTPAAAYPIAFWVVIAGLALVGLREGRRETAATASFPA